VDITEKTREIINATPYGHALMKAIGEVSAAAGGEWLKCGDSSPSAPALMGSALVEELKRLALSTLPPTE